MFDTKSITSLHLALSFAALLMLIPDPALASSGKAFKTPREAADAFVIAVAARQEEAMAEILGTDWRDYLPTDEFDQEDLDRFLAAWIENHGILFSAYDRALLAMGNDDWTLPIPIVLGEEGWQFDMEAGHEEILLRQIGRNVLAAIES